MAKLVILASSWPRPRSSHIWPLIQNFDESNCHLFFITSILALKTMKSVKKWQSYAFWGHWRSSGGHGVVSVLLEPKNTHRYWKNLNFQFWGHLTSWRGQMTSISIFFTFIVLYMQKAFHRGATCLCFWQFYGKVTRSHYVTLEVTGSHVQLTWSQKVFLSVS